MADGGKMRQQREVAKETGDAKEVKTFFSAPFWFSYKYGFPERKVMMVSMVILAPIQANVITSDKPPSLELVMSPKAAATSSWEKSNAKYQKRHFYDPCIVILQTDSSLGKKESEGSFGEAPFILAFLDFS